MKTKIMVLVSWGDQWTPIQQCLDIRGVTETVSFDRATHAWDIPAPDRVVAGEFLRYDPQADRESRAATQRFLKEHLQ